MTPLGRRIAEMIRHDGPMRLDHVMGLANAHYYATRDPLGADGDFITAPEISQLFGEMIGLCLVDHWENSGAPQHIRLVELGPGRGTLTSDILRAAKVRPAFLDAVDVTFVETSAALHAKQAATMKGHERLTWAASLDAVPDDAPLYLVANEFFDALPIRQLIRSGDQWLDRVVALDEHDTLVFRTLCPAIQKEMSSPDGPQGRSGDPFFHQARTDPAIPDGAIIELNESAKSIAHGIGQRLSRHGGLALIIDYGHARTAPGDTLQAMKSHAFVHPLDQIGEADLTAHVDFQALARAANVLAHGPVTQGALLTTLGIHARLGALSRARPDQADTLRAGVARLTEDAQMGTLFKAMALTGSQGPIPAGFTP
jgi:SAM-dependent MidA family methyltransferase